MGKLHYLKAVLFESYHRPTSKPGFGLRERTHHYLYSEQNAIAVDITSIVAPDHGPPVRSLAREFTDRMGDFIAGRIKPAGRGIGTILHEGSCIEFEDKPYDDSSYGQVLRAMGQVATAGRAWFMKGKRQERATEALRSACVSSGMFKKH